jgi:hypothetical protein
MNKIISMFFLLILSLTLVSASYPQSHIGHALIGFEQVNSPIVQKCQPYLAITLDGDNGADVGVLHYGSSDNKLLGSYIYPHTREGFNTCLREAGADPESYCHCIGQGLHIVEDSFSHNLGGYTQKCISKYLGSNYFSHMSCEQDFQTKLVELWTTEQKSIILNGQLSYYDSKYLDTLFTETGGNSKFLKLMNSVAGVDITNDAKVIRNGYQGQGFYNTVYKDKLNLPWWAWGVAIGLIIVGLGMMITMFIFANGKWKWVQIIEWGIIMLIGIIIAYSFFTGTTWKITSFIVEVPTKFGLYTTNMNDVQYYDNQIQTAVNKFLTDGVLPVDDATGLSYYDRTGAFHKGALTQSETGFKWLWYGLIMPLFLFINIYGLYKALKRRK